MCGCLVLLVGAGLLTRSLVYIGGVDPGFSTEGLLTVQLQADRHELARLSRAEHTALTDALLERLSALPGVVSVAAAASPPLPGWDINHVSYGIEDRPEPAKARAKRSCSSASWALPWWVGT